MKSSRLRTLAIAIAAGSLMMSMQAAAAVALISASADSANNMITIKGSDLASGPKKTQVYLGTTPLTIVGTPTNSQIIASMHPVDPGTYLLTVTTGPGTAHMEEMWVTIGAVGPAGPAGPVGPQGPQGETGATGPQGLKGDTGAQGPQGVKGDTGAQGPQGVKGDIGPAGASVTVVQLLAGDPNCAAGGAAITAQGVTAYVCSSVATTPPPPPASPSKILDLAGFEEIADLTGQPVASWTLCYRKSVDGPANATFHANCDGKGRTILVAKTDTDKVLGGYTTQSWGGACAWKTDPAAFLYSFTNSHKHALLNPGRAIFACGGFGPVFGEGNDLFIDNGGGTSVLGVSYACRVGLPGSGVCVNDFASPSITFTEIEVFYAP